MAALLLLAALVMAWMEYGQYVLAQLSYELPSLNFSLAVGGISAPEVSGTVQPATLVIPKINLQAPIQRGVPMGDQTIYDAALNNGVALASDSASLEAATGNSFIFGHSSNFAWHHSQYDSVFALLPKLETGDTVQIQAGGQTATYKVNVSKVINANDLQYVGASKSRELTLATCWPVGTSWKRWVVQATQVS